MENMLCHFVGYHILSSRGCSAVSFMPWRTTPMCLAFPSSLSPLGEQLLRPSLSHSCWGGGEGGGEGGGRVENVLSRSPGWEPWLLPVLPFHPLQFTLSTATTKKQLVNHASSLPRWIIDDNSHITVTKNILFASCCSQDFSRLLKPPIMPVTLNKPLFKWLSFLAGFKTA